MTSMISPQEQDKRLGVEVLSQDSESPFQKYTATEGGKWTGCSSGVITDRGRWEITYIPDSIGYGMEDDCNRAQSMHSAIVENL